MQLQYIPKVLEQKTRPDAEIHLCLDASGLLIVCTQTNADTRTRMQTLTRGRRRTYADADAYILRHTHATHADARRRTQTRADTRRRAWTHADARRRTQTNARPVWGRMQPQDASGRKTFVQGLSGCTIYYLIQNHIRARRWIVVPASPNCK